MATEEQTQEDDGAAWPRPASDTLTRHRQPHRQDLRARDHRRHRPRDGPAPDQGQRGRLRDDGLRPGLHQHRLLPLGDHLHRRREGHPPAPRLPDRAALREVELPRGRLPADLRRAADRSRSSSAGPTTSPTTPSSTRTSSTSSRASATTPTRWGCCSPAFGALSTFYPDAKHIDDPEERYMAAIRMIAKVPTLAAFAYRHNMGLPYVYPDNDLSYSGELPLDDVQEDRGEVRARSAAGEGARRPLHPPRRPRAELLDQRRARRRLVRGRPLLGRRRGSRRALRAASRRRQRGGAADAAPDRGRRRTSPTSSRA